MPTTNPYQSTPSAAGVSKRLPLPPSAHHNSGPSDLVVSPQAKSAPISGHCDLELPGSWPADHGNGMGMQGKRMDQSATGSHLRRGSACMANGSGSGSASTSAGRQSISTASTLTLTEGLGPSVEEQLLPTLRAAERGINSAYKTAWCHKCGMNIAWSTLTLLMLAAYIAASIATGRQANIVIVVLAGAVNLIAGYLALARGQGEPETSSVRAVKLETFTKNLRVFMRDHGHRTGSMVEPEIKERVVWNQRQFTEIMGRSYWGLNTLQGVNNKMKADKQVKTVIAVQKGKMEESVV
ncbi:hypothetical protein LXA43DRAFT_542448 [Ganoderma leucocontextum]|nr:hypothetical protein LXA43DRAFT_542448 [Ganoderma leucocontextum]